MRSIVVCLLAQFALFATKVGATEDPASGNFTNFETIAVRPFAIPAIAHTDYAALMTPAAIRRDR
jgi:hypothetical protein